MADDKQETRGPDFLHPEILSRQELTDALRQRLVPIDSLQRQSKEALLELYYKNVLPMPQRSFKQNRHGRELTRRQIMLAKRKRTYSDMTATTWSGTNKAKEMSSQDSSGSSRFICSFNLPQTSGVRIKPPPVLISGERKIIRLGKSKSSESTSNGDNNVVKSGTIRLTNKTGMTVPTGVKDNTKTVKVTPGIVHTNGNSKPTVVIESPDTNTVIKKISTVTITKVMPPKTDEPPPKAVKLKRRSYTPLPISPTSTTSSTVTSPTTPTAPVPKTPTSPDTPKPMDTTEDVTVSNKKQSDSDCVMQSHSEDTVKLSEKRFHKISWP